MSAQETPSIKYDKYSPYTNKLYWYPTVADALDNHKGNRDTRDSVLVATDYRRNVKVLDEQGDYISAIKISKKYRVFTDIVDLYKHLQTIDPKHSIYYEYIRSRPQKFKMDLDCSRDIYPEADPIYIRRIVSNAVCVVYDLFFGITLKRNRDIIWFDSSSDKKLSHHLVINNGFLPDNKHAKILYEVIKGVVRDADRTGDIADMLDSSVYSSGQCFRMFGSTKVGANRNKKIIHDYMEGYTWRALDGMTEFRTGWETLKETLVGRYDKGGVILTLPKSYQPRVVVRDSEIYDKDVDVKKLYKMARRNLGGEWGFKLGRYNSDAQIIDLPLNGKRIECFCCKRVHDHMGGYIKIYGNGNVILGCRRFDGKGGCKVIAKL